MKQSKTIRKAYESFDRLQAYEVPKAIEIMLEHAKTKFDATAEIHFTLGIDPKHADQQIRTTVSLPHGTGKTVRIAAFCEDEKARVAKAAGAVEAGADELIEKVSKGWTDFDAAVATPGMMKNLAKIARVLGPRGLMPNPKAGTVNDDLDKIIGELKAGRIEFRNDKDGIVHTVFGKISFGDKKLQENLSAIIQAIRDAKPSGQKGIYMKNITINSTMGPGIRIAVS